MANTIMTSKNSFEEGLVLDFSPDNTLSNCLTNALNATLLTFNGNEMALQNDMGNGRVETAYLPEGYVPVGSCEFGDIIYVVSYNPIINKSLIGCFPSPERNLSNDEIGAMNLRLSWTDFQESTTNGEPNGKLKSSSVKKILYGSKNMNPGDKYVIYSELLDTGKYLSDYGSKSHLHNSFPKLVKVHVVSIEESGKIVYLDSTTKWYKDNDYYLSSSSHTNAEGNPDLDSYRTLANSAYSVFSSKVSGKLALLIELEKITGFSCSWIPYITETTTDGILENTTYSIYWDFNWSTNDNNINPNGVILTESDWSGIEKNHKGLYLLWRENSNGNLILGKENSEDAGDGWVSDLLTKPDSYETDITRKYNPEDFTLKSPYTSLFDLFINEYEFNTYLESELTRIREANGENDEIKLPTPYKLNIYKENGLPIEGNYLVNCTNVILNEKGITYYTADNKGSLLVINQVAINDDLVNNYFHYPIIKHFADFTIPTKLIFDVKGEKIEKTPNISNLIYHYKLAPTMPYGILEEFAQEGYIDFSKIGKGVIELNTWKYYNYENTSTLTWGMDAYPEPGKGIQEVVFEFYDNNGFAAAYHNKGKLSYSGTFTEYITLNEAGTNYKLNNITASNIITYHKGITVTKDYIKAHPNNVYIDSNNTEIDISTLNNPDNSYTEPFYQDDSGTLYSNFLYLVKIIVKYSVKGALGEYIDNPETYRTKYRWYWTNSMFNEQYYNVKDFKDLQFTLNLDFNALYKLLLEANAFSTDLNYSVPNTDPTELGVNEYSQLKAKATVISLGKMNTLANITAGNVSCKIQSGLYNDYNMFNLNKDLLENINTTVYLGKSYIESPELPEVVSSESVSYTFPGIYPVNETSEVINEPGYVARLNKDLIGPTLGNMLGIEDASGPEINETDKAYKNYKNTFSLTFPNRYDSNLGGTAISKVNIRDSYLYINYKGEVTEVNLVRNVTFSNLEMIDSQYGSNFISFLLSGIVYSKYYEYKAIENISALLVRPLIYTDSDLGKYNLRFYDNHFYFKTLGGICIGMGTRANSGYKTKWRKGDFDNEGRLHNTYAIGGSTVVDNTDKGTKEYSLYHNEVQKTDLGQLADVFPGITPFILSREHSGDDDGSEDWGREYRINHGKDSISEDLAVPSLTYKNYFDDRSFQIDNGGIKDNLEGLRTENLFMILALKDVANKLHFLNTFIPVWHTGIGVNLTGISLKLYYENLVDYDPFLSPLTLGDAVAVCLMNLYYSSGLLEKEIPYLRSVNLVNLVPHTYTFTKDIIFELEAAIDNEENTTMNDLILLQGMRYPEYVDSVIRLASQNSDPNHESILTNKDSNVSLKLLGILKNCPLQFKFNYIVPVSNSSNITPTYVVNLSNGTLVFPDATFVPKNLYYQDPNNPEVFNVLKEGSNFRYSNLYNFRLSSTGTKLLIGDRSNRLSIIENPNFGNAFKFADNEQLICKETSEGWESTMFSINGKQDDWAGLWPIHQKEVFLPMGELV